MRVESWSIFIVRVWGREGVQLEWVFEEKREEGVCRGHFVFLGKGLSFRRRGIVGRVKEDERERV